MKHITSDGVIQCQGQNPRGIVAVLTKPVGGPQIRNREVVKMPFKRFFILMSIL